MSGPACALLAATEKDKKEKDDATECDCSGIDRDHRLSLAAVPQGDLHETRWSFDAGKLPPSHVSCRATETMTCLTFNHRL
jgi:hypothetical protein